MPVADSMKSVADKRAASNTSSRKPVTIRPTMTATPRMLARLAARFGESPRSVSIGTTCTIVPKMPTEHNRKTAAMRKKRGSASAFRLFPAEARRPLSAGAASAPRRK
ncbi:hypothetical protein D3C86_1466170 [compost metagenome]